MRPVTLDGRGTDVVATIREFTEAGVPVLIRISGDYPLPVERPTMPGWGPSVPAYRITAAWRPRRTVLWRDRTRTGGGAADDGHNGAHPTAGAAVALWLDHRR